MHYQIKSDEDKPTDTQMENCKNDEPLHDRFSTLNNENKSNIITEITKKKN